MLLTANTLKGYSLDAEDGQLGEIASLLFDQRDWQVRYVVARTMRWLGREVLVAPEAFAQTDAERLTVAVNLTKDQVRESPSIDLDAPVSRQQWTSLHSHYGWSMSWAGFPGHAVTVPAAVAEAEPEPDGDPNLRSTTELTNYALQVEGAAVGGVEDFVVDTEAWNLHFLIANTGSWLSRRHVCVRREDIGEIEWDQHRVNLAISKDDFYASPEFDATAPINREVRTLYRDYGGRIRG